VANLIETAQNTNIANLSYNLTQGFRTFLWSRISSTCRQVSMYPKISYGRTCLILVWSTFRKYFIAT